MLNQILSWLQTLPPEMQTAIVLVALLAVVAGGGFLAWKLFDAVEDSVENTIKFLLANFLWIALIGILIWAMVSPTGIPTPWGVIGGNRQRIDIQAPGQLLNAIRDTSAAAQPALVGEENSGLLYMQKLEHQSGERERLAGNLPPIQALVFITDTAKLQRVSEVVLYDTDLAVQEPRLSYETWAYLRGYADALLHKANILATAPITATGATTVTVPTALPAGVQTAISKLTLKAPQVIGADEKCEQLPLAQITDEVTYQVEKARLTMCVSFLSADLAEAKATNASVDRIQAIIKRSAQVLAIIKKLGKDWGAYSVDPNNIVPTPTIQTTPSAVP